MALKMGVVERAEEGQMVTADVQHNPRIAPDSLKLCLRSLQCLMQSLPSSASEVTRLSASAIP